MIARGQAVNLPWRGDGNLPRTNDHCGFAAAMVDSQVAGKNSVDLKRGVLMQRIINARCQQEQPGVKIPGVEIPGIKIRVSG